MDAWVFSTNFAGIKLMNLLPRPLSRDRKDAIRIRQALEGITESGYCGLGENHWLGSWRWVWTSGEAHPGRSCPKVNMFFDLNAKREHM
jgi:hypothetical protein